VQNVRNTRVIFQWIKSWTGSTRGEPGWVRAVHHGPTAVRTEGTGARRRADQSTASGRSDALKLTGGGAIERGEHGELSPSLTGARAVAWRPGDAAAQRGHGKLGAEGFQRGRGEDKGSARCGVLRGSSGGFYRAGGGRRGRWPK
jgi:hypothetical protein